jgi:transcription antitermination factor NusG
MVSAGEFRNRIGQVRQVRRGTVTVAINVMGRDTVVDLPIGFVEKLAGRAVAANWTDRHR